MIGTHLRVPAAIRRVAPLDLGSVAPGTHLILASWRWFACLASALLWANRSQPHHATDRAAVFLGVATATTAVVTIAGRRGWEAMRRRPALLVPDVLVSAVVLAAGGADVFVLYAVSPLLAAGVLFGPGAVATTLGLLGGVTAVTSLAGLRPDGGELPGLLTWLGASGSVLLCFALAATVRRATRADAQALRDASLRASLELKNNELSRRNRELQTFEEIASVMQTTMDVSEVQERVVTGVTDRLGFPRALLGLCDESEVRVTGWLARGRGGADIDHLLTLDLTTDGGIFGDALRTPMVTLLNRAAARSDGDGTLLAGFDTDAETLVAVPIRCRGHLVGGLFLEPPAAWAGLDADTRTALDRLATQAGLALANVRLCVERTQKLTQEQERMRIAADMHDGIAQALFGVVYQLSGCATQLPPDSALRAQLEDLGSVSQRTLHQVRQAIFDIWPSDLSGVSLARELHAAVSSLAPELSIDVTVVPEYDGLDLDIRKAVFRIAQEAVNNVIKHARARTVCVSVESDIAAVLLRVEDDGVGVGESSGKAGMGLRGMSERAEALGGTVTVTALPRGTCLVARMPRTVCRVR